MRLGLVGAGEVAWRHAAAAAEVDGLTVTAVFDPVPERAARLAEEYAARAVAGFDEVLAAVDLVVLAVPHGLHEGLALRALAAGRKVLVEKPMATTVEECDRMIAAGLGGLGGLGEGGGAESGGIEGGAVPGPADLVVGQQGRFFEQVRAARGELARLGRPLLYLDRRSTDYQRPDRPGWFADPALSGGGIAMLVGVHSIDRAAWLLGSAPVAVAGSTATPDGWSVETSAAATLYLADGMRAHLTLIDSPVFFHETTIVCARGTLVVDAEGLSVDGRRVLTVDGDREYTASFRRQYRAILRGAPMATLAEGRLAVAAVRAWYRSAASGGAVVSV
ncbi:Gfo/Idh/MocA family oxidoreductase [Actinoplanes sp. NPDC051411]|uniref:Gfo/Idh/MocA family protein n=1 Tax=Actinoplanes sp. NPDC051411 TaxID=3155522 RepID=UPI003417839F